MVSGALTFLLLHRQDPYLIVTRLWVTHLEWSADLIAAAAMDMAFRLCIYFGNRFVCFLFGGLLQVSVLQVQVRGSIIMTIKVWSCSHLMISHICCFDSFRDRMFGCINHLSKCVQSHSKKQETQAKYRVMSLTIL